MTLDPRHLATTSLFSNSKLDRLYFTCKWNHMVPIILWLVSLNRLSSCFIHIVACSRMLFFMGLNLFTLFRGWVESAIILCHISSVHSLTIDCSWCFHLLTAMENAAINMSVPTPLGSNFNLIQINVIEGSYGNSTFNLLRKWYCLHSGYIISHPHSQCTMVPISPQAHEHSCFLLSVVIASGDGSLWLWYVTPQPAEMLNTCSYARDYTHPYMHNFFGEMSSHKVLCPFITGLLRLWC